MGIEPTWDAPQRPTPDLKSGSPTSELGTSAALFNPAERFWQGFAPGPSSGRLRVCAPFAFGAFL